MQALKVIITGSNETTRIAFIKAVSEAGVLSTPQSSVPGSEAPIMALGRRSLPDARVLYLFGVAAEDLDAVSPATFAEMVVGCVVLVDGIHNEALEVGREAIAFMLEHSDAPFVVAVRGLRSGDRDQQAKVGAELGVGPSAPPIPFDSTDREHVREILGTLVSRAKTQLEVAAR